MEVEQEPADEEAARETMSPLRTFGSARPRKTARRFAGVASSGESVCVWRSPPIVSAMPKTPAIAATCTPLPTTKNASFPRG